LAPTLPAGRTIRAEAPTRARALLTRVGLGGHLTRRPAELSGGECQRVAVVRALINRPALLLADEPTGSLDHATALQLADLLADLNREEGMALIVATHALDVAARMTRTLALRDGRLYTPEGSPS
jgi:predicted ABC-type transport system involved in lysophospholipase L1 biosynthesis ATPase subunit